MWRRRAQLQFPLNFRKKDVKIIEEKRLDELVGKSFKIRKNPIPNEEKLVPFVQQLIEKHFPKNLKK